MNPIKAFKLGYMKGRRGFGRDEHANNGAIELMIGGILTVLSFVVVFAFWPTLTSNTETAATDPNTSAAAAQTIRLIPLTFAAGLLVGGIVFLVAGVRKLGSG